MIDWKVQLFELNYCEKEKKAASDVIDERWLTMGKKTKEFESNFSKYLSNEVECVAVSSATAALHLSLMAKGISLNDEVIIPALTFISDLNIIKQLNAEAVLADSDSLENWNVSLKSVEEKITNKTKAIIVVHYAGFPCKDIFQIRELCKKKDILLIEDVAHAPGAFIEDQKCGTIGDLGCFSFFSNKNLSIGEGGMVSSSNKDLFHKVSLMRSHGMTSLSFDRHKGRTINYDVTEAGLNYRLDEVRSSIGLVQLAKLDEANQKRKELFERYQHNLTEKNLSLPFTNLPKEGYGSAYHIFPIMVPENVSRLSIIEELRNNQIQTSIHYPGFWEFSKYEKHFNKHDFQISSKICDREITLPLFPTMTFEQVDYVCEKLLFALDKFS